MRKPPEAFARLGRALGGAVKHGGGSARWRFAGRGVPATRVHYGARGKAQKHQGGGPKLTKCAGWSELQRSDVGGEVVRRRWAELRGPGAGALLRASDPPESTRSGAAEVHKGSRWPKSQRR
jgi:hypothetical protein